MSTPNQQFKYPDTANQEQIDFYHGIAVEDPYRWLEDPDTKETQAWVKQQNELTFGYLGSLEQRSTFQERITQLLNYEKYSIPFKQNNRYFFFKNDGLQNQSVLYTVESLGDNPTVLLDPNLLSEDGTIALSGLSISDDAHYMAYGLSQAGSDWSEWRIRDINSGEDLEDLLKWVKFSGASWTKDNQGFFYSRYDEPDNEKELQAVNYYQKLYYHRLGTPQSSDTLIYQRPDQKEWGFSGQVTEDGEFLIISVWQGTESKNLIFYQDLNVANAPVKELINQFEASYGFIDHQGSVFWLQTDLNAPKGKVIAIDITQQNKDNWQDIIPEAIETLEGVNVLNNQFIIAYLKDAHACVKIFSLDGQFKAEVTLPGLGSVGGFGGKREDKETFYIFTSFSQPATIYHYDLITGKSSLFRQPEIVGYDSSLYVTKQVFYPSKDGTLIPMFIVHKQGLELNGQNPTYLYGYGGFGISLTPNFSVTNIVWLEKGGVYAVPNLRGGGEYGEEWHQAGTKLNKQNVFDDFIAAAEWLIQSKYTAPKHLAIGGGSNGGLLVGTCLTQRPELFGAVIPAVGVLDMLRFAKFTIGWAWQAEYGNVDDLEEFKVLFAYSPLHNIKKGINYPATLITTADHDDRVVPAHSYKFVATLQKAQAGGAPILIRIETQAGHGGGKPTTKIIEEAADSWAFLWEVLQ